MEDKMFDLMTKMYSEFSEFRKEITNDVIRLENKIDTSSKTLFDGYQQVYEKLDRLENKVDSISSKVEKQEVEIKVIKGGK